MKFINYLTNSLPTTLLALTGVCALSAGIGIATQMPDGTGWIPALLIMYGIACAAAIVMLRRRANARLAARLPAAEAAEIDDQIASMTQLDLVLNTMNDAVIVTDIDGNIVRLNDSAAQMLGYGRDELFGEPIRKLVAEKHDSSFRLSDEKRAVETLFKTQQGNKIPISYTTSRFDTDIYSFAGYIISARNISERKVTEQRIRYLARIDPLTRLSNRMQFHHLLQRSIARAKRRKTQVATFYLDIDRFKDINDTYGHATGDSCLETVANRLTALLPEKAIIGRLAGDEFAVGVEWDGHEDSLTAYLQSTARHMLAELTRIQRIQGREIHTSVSIGIACYPRDADNVIDLIRSSDAALYRAKKVDGNRFEFFDARMNAEEAQRLMLKSKLRRSYELNELLIHYQPKVDVRTGVICGGEALVRWEMSELGIVLPSEFIPLAEETNLIIEIGEWVLNQVCADINQWEAALHQPCRMSINLSVKQLGQPSFLQRMQTIFERHNVNPACVELEITESTLMHDAERSIRLLNQLHEFGINLSIDDFGTGYSSLSALQQFPISTLKIDRSFIHDLRTNRDGAKIVPAIIDMAHGMGLQVVAEGVESELQLQQLKTLKCDMVQGLLFGKPMAAAEFVELLRTEKNGYQTFAGLFA